MLASVELHKQRKERENDEKRYEKMDWNRSRMGTAARLGQIAGLKLILAIDANQVRKDIEICVCVCSLIELFKRKMQSWTGRATRKTNWRRKFNGRIR